MTLLHAESSARSTPSFSWSRALMAWGLLIFSEIAHGILRSVLLVPTVGLARSNQIGVFTGSLIILGVAWLTVKWVGAWRRRDQWCLGGLWLALTLAFEWLFGLFVLGLTWQRLAADYDPRQGGLLGLGMAFLLVSPMIAARLRGLHKPE